MGDEIERFLCISSYEKGQDFLRQCAEMGVKPTLLTVDKLRDADWPREALEELATMPAGLTPRTDSEHRFVDGAGPAFDRIVALDEFDQETAAQIREHMRAPGNGHQHGELLSRQAGHADERAGAGFPGAGVLPGAELRRAARLTWSACRRRGC